MGYKSNRGRGAIANAKVNKLPRRQSGRGYNTKDDQIPNRIGSLAQLSRDRAKKEK